MQELRSSNVSLGFGNIVVNNINHNSGIFIGENMQFGWSAHMKANHGFGYLLGYLDTVQINAVFIYDNDFIDAPISEYAIMSGTTFDSSAPVPMSSPAPVVP